MRKFLLAAFLLVAPIQSAKAYCCDATEIQKVGDLNYLARAALNHTGPLKDRLYALAMQLKAGTWHQWSDADRPYILGLMAALPDYQNDAYNKSVLDSFASEIGVPIQQGVIIPTPSPVVVVTPPPPAPTPVTTTSSLDSLVRSIIREEIAKIPSSTSTAVGSGYPDLIGQNNGEFLFMGIDNGGSRQQGIRGNFRVHFGVNNYDGGARVLQNWNCFNPALPWATYGNDSHGSFSYNQGPCPTSTWPAKDTYGQAFVLDGGAYQAAYDYQTGAQLGRSLLFASQHGGIPFVFAVTPVRNVGDPVLNKAVMRLNSDNSPNPIEFVVDGIMRRIRTCVVNNVNTLCY